MQENRSKNSKTNNKIEMEDKGITPEILYDLYVIQNKTHGDLHRTFEVSEGVLNRWLHECGIPKKKGSRYSFDVHFFDNINTEEKAYWLGFIWCDGYASERIRKGRVTERPVKISLSRDDESMLLKLKDSIKSNHPIHNYEAKRFGVITHESRITLNNLYFGKVLQEKYGMIPHRTDASKVLNSIPKHMERHFLRGVFDADGTMVNYYLKSGKNKGQLKSALSFSTYTQITEWIQHLLIREGIKDNMVKTHKRHGEGSDGDCVTLTYSGTQQALSIAKYMYEESSISMDRKRGKLLELKGMLERRRFENV